MRLASFRKYSISQLTCSDSVSSKTQIVRAFRIKFCKIALAETSVFGLFDQYQLMEDQTTLPSYGNGTN